MIVPLGFLSLFASSALGRIGHNLDKLCYEEDKIYWPDDGLCYDILSQGPCKSSQWLVLDAIDTPVCNQFPCDNMDKEVIVNFLLLCYSFMLKMVALGLLGYYWATILMLDNTTSVIY